MLRSIVTGFEGKQQGKTPLPTSAAPFSPGPEPSSRPAPGHKLLHDQDAFEAALALLAGRDAAFVATLLGDDGAPRLRRRDPGFAGLAWTIIGQQVSTASAAAIYGRLQARLGTVDAASVTGADDDALRNCGLSAGKLRTLRAVAAACAAGSLDFAALAAAEAEAAHAALVAIHGIGPWTADVFLLFCLGHADAWPAGDLALQEAVRLALALPVRPGTGELIALGERWRPHRGVAAHCLWAYYGAEKARAASAKAASVKSKTPTGRRAKRDRAKDDNEREP